MAKYSNHYCSVTMKHVMAWCYRASQGEVERYACNVP